MSNWVCITNEIPEGGLTVLAAYKNRHGWWRIIRAMRIADKTVEDTSERFDDADYDDATGVYYVPAGWYEVTENYDEGGLADIPGDEPITHWQALPAPPTEDKKP